MGLFGKKKVLGFETYGDEEKAKKKSYLKEGLKKLFPPKSPEQIAWEQELKKKTQEARRKAFLKEAVKSAEARAKAQAKAKFNPQQVPGQKKKNEDVMDVLMRL